MNVATHFLCISVIQYYSIFQLDKVGMRLYLHVVKLLRMHLIKTFLLDNVSIKLMQWHYAFRTDKSYDLLTQTDLYALKMYLQAQEYIFGHHLCSTNLVGMVYRHHYQHVN